MCSHIWLSVKHCLTLSTQTSPYFAPDPIGAGHCNLTGEGHVCGFLFELQTFPHYWHRWLTLRRHSLLYSLQMGMMVPSRQNTKIFFNRCDSTSECHVQQDAIPQDTHIFIIEGSLEVKLPKMWSDEKQRWEESEKRREERRPEKRKSPKTEDAVAQKGRKVAIHCVFPMICGFGGSKSRLAKAAGAARRCGAKHISKSKWPKHFSLGPLLEDRTSKKCTPLWREAHFEVKSVKTDGPGALLDVQMSFCMAGARDYAPCSKWAKREGFVAFPKTMAGVGHMQRIWQDVFRVTGAVQETCSSELFGGQGADFLRGVAFWSVRSSGLLRWFCVTSAALCMTGPHFFVAGAIL